MSQYSLDEYLLSPSDLEDEILKIAKRFGVITADDLHVLDPSLDRMGLDRRVYGLFLRNLAVQGHLERLGYVKSGRYRCHGRPILQWRFVEG
jgi:hypothetical protein